jgi:thiosulfate/3-mercaptopyruvate sulfurtransferase
MKSIIEPDAFAGRVDSALRLVQVTTPQVYARGHIPGAVNVSPRALVCGVPPATGRLPALAELQAVFAAIGYRPDLEIVVYDDEGGGWAGRFIWTLDMIGHRHWRYLNGGLQGWIDAGHDLVTLPTAIEPTAPTLQLQSWPRVSAEDILAHLDDGDMVIWDARSYDEYVGRRIAAARGGHIPGAVHLEWLDLMDPGRGLRLREDVGRLMREHGITPDKHIVTHCQTHHRSGLSYMVARCLDYPRVSAYDGSWSEWGNREDTPVARAEPDV